MEQVRLARSTTARELAGPAMSMVALAEGMRGDSEACARAADEAISLSSRITLSVIEDMIHWALGVLDTGAGRWGDALAHLSSVTHPILALASSFDRADAAVRSGEDEAAVSLLESMTEFAEASGVAWASGRVAYLRALLAPEEAERRFAESLGLYAQAERPSEEARVELAFGEWLRRHRQRVRARNHLRTALHGFETLGMPVWADRARSELRASGETARRSQPSTYDQLTPQEHHVASFVGRGLSNRAVAAQLFLSPRTVDFHLRNVYAKLGITSRTELAQHLRDSATG
jgi:DNA-binding CsgD family transcriptional regulator